MNMSVLVEQKHVAQPSVAGAPTADVPTASPGDRTRKWLLGFVGFGLVLLVLSRLVGGDGGQFNVNGAAATEGSVFAEELVRTFSATTGVVRASGSYSSSDGVVLSVNAIGIPIDSSTQWLSDALIPLADQAPLALQKQSVLVLLEVDSSQSAQQTDDEAYVRLVSVPMSAMQDPSQYLESLGTTQTTSSVAGKSSTKRPTGKTKSVAAAAAPTAPAAALLDGDAADDFETASTNWLPLAGQWRVNEGEYQQQDNSGFDFISQSSVAPNERFSASVRMRSLEGDLNAGFLIFQPTKGRRNGATVIDLTNAGSFLRWGHYDKGGPYVFDDAKQLATPVDAKKGVSFQVTYADGLVRLYLDNRQVAQFTPKSADGNKPLTGGIGLVTSSSKVAFDDFSISGI
jgi:hypothetical protein